MPPWRASALSTLLLVTALIGSALAGSDGSPESVVINVAQHAQLGPYLSDEEGRSLYMSVDDQERSSVCVDRCAAAWPPLYVSQDADVAAGRGVAPTLFSIFERPDGRWQLAYNGLPLYRYVFDDGPGDTAGLGVGGTWFLVSPFGTALRPPAAVEEASSEPTVVDVDADLLADLLGMGAELFAQNCAVCHGEAGRGLSGPALAGANLADDRSVIRRVIFGGGHMPGFGSILSDEQIAAVVSYVRRSWGNDFRLVTAEEVVSFR